MQLDGPFGLTKTSPRENRKAKVNRTGIQGVDRFIQLHTKIIIGIEFSGGTDQNLGKISVDTSVAGFVSIRKGAS